MRQIKDLKGPQGERMRRWICSGATEVTPDKQGRIVIPQALRTYAGLEKDVVVAGAGRKAEIWDYNLWKQSEDAFDPADSGMLEDLCL
jgi:MraZ protein